MDEATFDAYVVANPPGAPNAQGLYGTSAPPPRPAGMPMAGGAPNAATDPWNSFFMAGPTSVQMPTFQTANQDQARTRQQQVIQDLQRAAMGDPNSRAQQGLREAYGAANSQQSSLGSTMRGQSAGAAMRGVQQGQQGLHRNMVGDQQMLQLQEQQAAQQMLAQLLSQQQGQDIAQAQGMAQGVNQGNAMDEAMRQFYAQQGSGLNQEQGQIGMERNAAQLGFDLEGRNTTNRLLRQGAGALATAFATGSSQGGGKSSQQTIDNAFNNG
jgi:hypothetical protein